ncbi:MAG: PEP-CTERM/exosortase system-associated acyltransferase [Methyloprofundus sp.]|nr:PEP-CTERM/exosortase system-associated acyltransferase [Methyloprofundus sp.]
MFDTHFEVFLADTPESKEIHYSIRYQVYCEEKGFENKNDFPMEMEKDNYDQSSEHFIVRHKESGEWVAAMRLVISGKNGLPMEQHCVLHEEIESNHFQKAAELSRLCVLEKVRKSAGEGQNLLRKNSRRVSQSIIWGLLNAASEYCHHNTLNWYFMTCTSLKKVLSRGGFKMATIGDLCHHKGERYPFRKDTVDAYHNEEWRNSFINGKAFTQFSEYFRGGEANLKVA